jgi:hypothetical protein
MIDYSRFEFTGWQLDGRSLHLGYRLSAGSEPDVHFDEVLALPATLPAPDPSDAATRVAIEIVHRTFGVSYYKVSCPREVSAAPASESVARYWDTLYSEGLGEFFFRNRIELTDRVHFPRSPGAVAQAAHRAPADERALVLVGGGKDSVVAREVLRHAGVACDAFALGSAPWIERSAAAMGLALHTVGRTLDPKLFELNARGALNGHVPISACIAAVSVLVALSGGYSAVIAANERSADEGNTSWNGVEINHQWSKSFRFETAFRALVEEQIANAPLYLSVLRPLSELAITRAFTLHPEYRDAVSSCNKNFRVQGPRAESRWCGRCPKCVFVYLMVAAHAGKEVLGSIFGADFLAIPENLATLADLAGVGGMKPFECVGTASESRAALGQLYLAGRLPAPCAAWYERTLATDRSRISAEFAASMTPDATYRLPGRWQSRLDAYLGSR